MNLPSRIDVIEVAPRDGLQSFGRPVDTGAKLAIIERLITAGLRTIEVTGFAHPAKIPQFADAEALCALLPKRDDVVYRGLAPNARGASRAVAAGVHEIVGLITASGTYLKKNQNMTFEQAIEQGLEAFRIADAAGRQFTMAIGLSFWCAYEGAIPEDRVLDIISSYRKGGVTRFYLAATVGLESPDHVDRLFRRAIQQHPDATFGFHVHNLGGRAPALALSAMMAGASWVESAMCGIGGGIAMPENLSAVGNYATEDLVTFLADSGVETGLDPGEILLAAQDVAAILGIAPRSFAGNGASRQGVRSLVSGSDMAAA